jgi:hypothetical protein
MGVVTYTVRQDRLAGEILGTHRHPGRYEPAIGDVIVVEGSRWRVTDHLCLQPSVDAESNTLVVEAIEHS